MTLLSIKTAIATILKTNYGTTKVVAEEIGQGFKKPAFFIELLPIDKILISPSLYSRVVTCKIHYFSPNQTHIENLKTQNELEVIFDMTLTVGDRIITLSNISGEEIEKHLQFQFDLNFIDSRDNTDADNYDLMENLELKEEF